MNYEELNIERKIGDIWEENGKQWKMLPGGIIMSVPKVSSNIIFDYCKECKKRIETKLDKHYYNFREKCFDCGIKEETKMRINNTWKEFEQELIGKNVDSYFDNIKKEIDEYVDSLIDDNINSQYVGQNGDVDNWWEGGITPEEVKKRMYEQIDEFKNKIKNG